MESLEIQTAKYAQVLVDIKKIDSKTFSYIIPDNLRNKIKLGQAVKIPFGRQGLVNGYVVGFSNYMPEGVNAKSVHSIYDEEPMFNLQYLKFLEWISQYYYCDIQTLLSLAIPKKFLTKKEKLETFIEFKTFDNATSRQMPILEKLQLLGKTKLIDFEKLAKTTRVTIKKLAEQNNIELSQKQVIRNPLTALKIQSKDGFPTLSDEQQKVYEGIKDKINSNEQNPILLHGITASGKTEIYFKLIEDTINKGKNVLFLAPEIALVSQLTYRMAKRFGQDEVAIWHSSITESEKFDVWQRLRTGEIRILAGARSAVFAPIQNLGLIIIDEEHESTYKQTNPAPRYDARFVCQKLAQNTGAQLILGSATPDVNSYYNAQKNNTLFSLKNRYNNAPLAKVGVINMKEEFYKNNRSYFSRALIRETESAISQGHQVMFLINRRGYSTITQCRECSHVVECPNCAIPMIYHADDNVLKCHYCDHQQSFSYQCPECGSNLMQNAGVGTQRLEMMAKKIFPDYRIVRLDSDVMNKRNEHLEILSDFNEGKIDILIGTQMIAKGLDNQNVTLVCAIDADGAFNLPDFRAQERGFQLLTQLAGRSGRGENVGKVYFQSQNPEISVLENAQQQDYENFYKTEIAKRAEFDYPPFCSIIRVIISSEEELKAQKYAQDIAYRFKEFLSMEFDEEQFKVLGASPCVIEKLYGHFRYNILIKNKTFQGGHFKILNYIKSLKVPKNIKLIVDVEPMDIL